MLFVFFGNIIEEIDKIYNDIYSLIILLIYIFFQTNGIFLLQFCQGVIDYDVLINLGNIYLFIYYMIKIMNLFLSNYKIDLIKVNVFGIYGEYKNIEVILERQFLMVFLYF